MAKIDTTGIICPYCEHNEVVGAGSARSTKRKGQKYQCKKCFRTFSVWENEANEVKEVKVEAKSQNKPDYGVCPTCGRPLETPLPSVPTETIDVTQLSEEEAAKVNWAINYMKENPGVGLKGLNNAIKKAFKGKGLRDNLRYNVFKGVKAGIYN